MHIAASDVFLSASQTESLALARSLQALLEHIAASLVALRYIGSTAFLPTTTRR